MLYQNDSAHCLVSVIVPVFNDERGINACLNSLDSQSLPKTSYEVIVVDNNSYPPIRLDPDVSDLVCLTVEKRPGAYAARNAGLKIARGDIIAFTDADCTPDPDWLQAGVHALKREKGNFIGGEVFFIKSNKPTALELYQILAGFQQRYNIERLGFSVTANLFVTHELINQVGFFNEALLSGGDREWCWRAKAAGFVVKYAPDVIVRTFPRRALSAAMRQTRRVAGGRYVLHDLRLPYISPRSLKPHRTGLAAARWILRYPNLSPWNRFKIFSIALVLKSYSIFEAARLSFGTSPERR